MGRGFLQVIGALGFSGDTTGPHLHLHVADSVDTLASEGLPFVITGYEGLGRYRNIGQLGRGPWEGAESVAHRRTQEWPAYNVVIRFDGSGASAQVR
jgi:murein DD-endopeptidase MepM/ murein hydrolase activator NlpD